MYLPENHARLKAAHTYVSEDLRALHPLCEPWGRLLHLGRLEEGDAGGNAGGGVAMGKPLQQASILEFLSPLPVPARGHLEEEVLLWRRFLENKVLLSFGKAFECKEPGWFRWSSPTRPTGFAWVSGLALLTVPFSPPLPLLAPLGPQHPGAGLVRTAPSIHADPHSLRPPPRDAEGPDRCLRANPSWAFLRPPRCRSRSHEAPTGELVTASWPGPHSHCED